MAKVSNQKKPNRGPAKEKEQITVRVDKGLKAEADLQMAEDGTRITDIVERGLMLALQERNHDLPLFTKQIRFVLANATREQQILIRGLAIRMVEEHLPKVKRSPRDELFWEFTKRYLELANREPHAEECLKYYSRFGKSAKEIAKLGRL